MYIHMYTSLKGIPKCPICDQQYACVALLPVSPTPCKIFICVTTSHTCEFLTGRGGHRGLSASVKFVVCVLLMWGVVNVWCSPFPGNTYFNFLLKRGGSQSYIYMHGHLPLLYAIYEVISSTPHSYSTAAIFLCKHRIHVMWVDLLDIYKLATVLCSSSIRDRSQVLSDVCP